MSYVKYAAMLAAVGLATWTAHAEETQPGTCSGWTVITGPGASGTAVFSATGGPDDVLIPLPPQITINGVAVPLTPPPPGAQGVMRIGGGAERPFFNVPLKKMKVTYLGVATSPADETLADQLRLSKGTGLAVDFVESGSPAAKAGLRAHDVLVKFNDQLLINQPQLSTLVRMQKPKDKVTLTLVREAKEQKVTAELSEKETLVGDREGPNLWVQPLTPSREPRNMADMFQPLHGALSPGITATTATTCFADGEHTLTITVTDGKKRLVAKDKHGKTLFDGPINTDEELKAVPEAIRDKLKTLQSMNVDIETPQAPARPERPARKSPKPSKAPAESL